LAGTPAPGPDDLDVYVPPDLVADLYAPDLVITPRYIGPSDQSARPQPPPAGEPAGPFPPPVAVGRSWLRLFEMVVVVLVTVAVAVPLTLIVAGYADHPVAVTPGPPVVPARPGAATTLQAAMAAPVSARPAVGQETGRPADGARRLEPAQRPPARTGRRAARRVP
jgi:hypothetical protein